MIKKWLQFTKQETILSFSVFFHFSTAPAFLEDKPEMSQVKREKEKSIGLRGYLFISSFT